MRRLVGVLAVALAIAAMPSFASAQEGKTMNAQGTVSAVSPESITVKGKADTMTFMIDKDTSVTAKGATHKSLALKADGKATVLTDFVKMGDTVTVAYHDMGSMKHASRINVTAAAAPNRTTAGPGDTGGTALGIPSRFSVTTFSSAMRRSERLILTAILFVGAALRFWGLTFGDSASRNTSRRNHHRHHRHWILYGGLNPHFFHWPSLEFYVVSAIYRIGWEIGHLRGLYRLKFDMYKDAAVHATPFLIVPRVLSAAAGVATIWLVYRLVDRLFDRLTAITAAFFVAVAFLHVRDSHFGVTDVPMTALVVAALVALASAVQDPTRVRRWALSGALSGLAASTKYNGGLVLAAGMATAVVVLIQSDAARRRKVLRGAVALVGAALIAFLCGTPYTILDAPHFFEGLQFDFSHLMEGHGVVLGRGWLHHLTFSLWYGLGAPLLIAGLAGMALLAATSWKKAVMILTFPVLYYITVGRGFTVFVRYITPVVPFLCITAAFLVVWIVRRLVREELVPPIVAVVAIAVAVPSLQRTSRSIR